MLDQLASSCNVVSFPSIRNGPPRTLSHYSSLQMLLFKYLNTAMRTVTNTSNKRGHQDATTSRRNPEDRKTKGKVPTSLPRLTQPQNLAVTHFSGSVKSIPPLRPQTPLRKSLSYGLFRTLDCGSHPHMGLVTQPGATDPW